MINSAGPQDGVCGLTASLLVKDIRDSLDCVCVCVCVCVVVMQVSSCTLQPLTAVLSWSIIAALSAAP